MDDRQRQTLRDATNRPAAMGALPIGFLAVVLPLIAVYGFATNHSQLSWPALICGVAAIAFTILKFQVNRRL